jgi:RNA polymerase sigma factor (sigma-70 family)
MGHDHAHPAGRVTHAPDAGARRPPRLRSDAQLVAGARVGCPAAGEEIVRRYRSQLRAHCARIAGPDAADDAVQEALVKALRALAAGRSPADLRPWLYRIARNAAIDELRRRPGDWEPLDPQIDGVAQPPQIAATRAHLRELLAGAAALPARQRAALRMRVVDERSYDEIALALGAGEGTVRALLHRARSRLRESAAVVLVPFWRIARHGPLAHGGAGAATAAKAGLVIGVLASAGAAAVALHPAPGSPGSHDRAVARAPGPPARIVPAAATSVTANHPSHSASAPADRARARHAASRATTTVEPRSASAHRTVAVARRPAAAGSVVSRRTPAATTSAAPARGGAGSAGADPNPAAVPPSASVPAKPPAPDPVAAAAPAAPVAPAPPAPVASTDAHVPAPTPAPAARGQVSAWTPDAPGGAEGLLAVQSGTNPAIARRVTTSTDLRCYRVAGGYVVSFGACPDGALAPDIPVASAEMQPADAGASWRLVYLILAA